MGPRFGLFTKMAVPIQNILYDTTMERKIQPVPHFCPKATLWLCEASTPVLVRNLKIQLWSWLPSRLRFCKHKISSEPFICRDMVRLGNFKRALVGWITATLIGNCWTSLSRRSEQTLLRDRRVAVLGCLLFLTGVVVDAVVEEAFGGRQFVVPTQNSGNRCHR